MKLAILVVAACKHILRECAKKGDKRRASVQSIKYERFTESGKADSFRSRPQAAAKLSKPIDQQYWRPIVTLHGNSGTVVSYFLSVAHMLLDMVSIYAYHKAGLSTEQWNEHVHGALQTALKSTASLADTDQLQVRQLQNETSDNLCRVIQISVPTKEPLLLSQCSSLSKTELQEVQLRAGVEYAIIPDDLDQAHKKPGLAVFDMDSTLIQQEVIDELARAVGLYPQVAAITEAAMRGEAPYTDFETSLRARVALLKGVPTSIWDDLKKSIITFTPGAKELVRTLKALGWKTAVLSGGFTPLANWVKDTLGLDYAYANHLVADEERGILTGELVTGKPIIHAEKKRELLLEIAAKEGLSAERVIAVGDGSNDLKMMEVAGLGIAFNAKPKVQQAAPVRLNTSTLLDVMHILGYSQSEVEKLLA